MELNHSISDLDFSGFPEIFDTMPPKADKSSHPETASGGEAEEKLTWEEFEKKLILLNVPTMEVEDLLFVLENMPKKDISISAYEQARSSLEGYIF